MNLLPSLMETYLLVAIILLSSNSVPYYYWLGSGLIHFSETKNYKSILLVYPFVCVPAIHA